MKNPSGEKMGEQGKDFEGTNSDRLYFFGEGSGSEIKPFHFDQEELEASAIGSEVGKLVKKMSIKHIVRENIQLRYKFEKTLGEGAFGKVKIASLHSDPTRKFAIKSIPRHLMDNCCGEKDKDDKTSAELDINEQTM